MARFISRAMTVEAGIRGDQLVSGGRALELVPHGIGGLWAGSLNKLLDRIDSGLAAGSVELTLPDTGVCNGAGLFDDPQGENAGGGCCGPASAAPEPVSLQPFSLSLNPIGG